MRRSPSYAAQASPISLKDYAPSPTESTTSYPPWASSNSDQPCSFPALSGPCPLSVVPCAGPVEVCRAAMLAADGRWPSITLLRCTGVTNIAEGLRTFAYRVHNPYPPSGASSNSDQPWPSTSCPCNSFLDSYNCAGFCRGVLAPYRSCVWWRFARRENCGCSSVGRAPRCQRGCRGFNSHHPLYLS